MFVLKIFNKVIDNKIGLEYNVIILKLVNNFHMTIYHLIYIMESLHIFKRL